MFEACFIKYINFLKYYKSVIRYEKITLVFILIKFNLIGYI